MWYNDADVPRINFVLWFDANIQCDTILRHMRTWRTSLWFDANIQCDTILAVRTSIYRELWFDANIQCDTMLELADRHISALWFDANIQCDTICSESMFSASCCDLMLIFNVIQFARFYGGFWICCDLMLIFNVIQCTVLQDRPAVVVIWC